MSRSTEILTSIEGGGTIMLTKILNRPIYAYDVEITSKCRLSTLFDIVSTYHPAQNMSKL